MRTLRNLIQIIQEDIIGTDNRVIASAWLFCIAILVALGFYLSSESMSFMGVADSREQQVNFEYPVEIKRVHVISGQLVKKGDLLVELKQSELNSKIRLLQQQLAKLQAEVSVRRHLNSIVSNSTDIDPADPLAVDVQDISDELRYLEDQKKNLYVFAEVSGIVGAVNFKKGERVPAFASLLTLSPENPSYVQGFVHESLQTRLEIGKMVSVDPVSSQTAPIEGKIVSVGSRIILMPARLMMYPGAQIYGREVVVEIPPRNGLLLGEKVQIKPKLNFVPFSSAVASIIKPTGEGPKSTNTHPQDVSVPSQLAKQFSFEPSGVVYLQDLKKFIVVSDDTDKEKSASLFLIDREGRVDDQALRVPGLGKVSDLESISQSGDHLFLMTSQGLDKKGKDKAERNLFIRARRTGLDFSDVESVDFKIALIKGLQETKDARIRSIFGRSVSSDLEIESHFVEGNRLYVGFKSPLGSSGEPVILVVDDLNAIFSKKRIDGRTLRLLNVAAFPVKQGFPHRLSDLTRINGRFYASTVCDDESCGAVWSFQDVDDRLVPEQIKFYQDLKPEGLAFDSQDSSIFVLFDQKDKAAKFVQIPMQSTRAKQASAGKADER